MASTLQVVAAPVALGVLIQQTFPKQVEKVAPFCPVVVVAAVLLICSSIIGQSASAVMSAGPILIMAILMLHTGGFMIGFGIAKVLGFEKEVCRTISIEVGMQNSALGVVLATQHFANPLTAVPCAISATAHSCIGSLFAANWRRQDNALEIQEK